MKKLTLLFLLFFIFSCGNEKKESNSPLTVQLNESENPKLTLLELIKNNSFNEYGYVLLMDTEDEYGYTKWKEWGPIYIFEKTIVEELKKFKSVEDFWYSDFGSKVIEKMIECSKNNKEKCYVN